ncbi:MAG: hypothetical protein ABI607_02305 [Betaproteobacteria bacterium]
MPTNRPLTRRRISRPLLFLAAVMLLIEEWLWRGTARFLRDLMRLPPMAACAAWVRRRTPYQALALFVLPVLSLLPLKGVIVLAFMHGRYALGIAVLVLEKLIFSAVFAALYQLTAPVVTQIGWVMRGQEAFLRMRSALHAWLEQFESFRESRAWLQRLRRQHWLRRRLGAAYRMQRRRTSRFCFRGS